MSPISRNVAIGTIGEPMSADARRPVCKALFCLVALSLCASTSSFASADGYFIPEPAYLKPPAIPTQRAVLTYRGGNETLIIESSLDAEGQRFGWIIPLPAEPTEFRRVSPGFLNTLSICIQPRITHDLGLFRRLLPWFGAVTALALLGILLKFTRPAFLVLLAILLIGMSLLLPALGHAGVGSAVAAEAVSVKKTVAVGAYDLTVLEADAVEALDVWLTDNGYAAIPEGGRGIVADYIGNGWCFVVAKLRREGAGLSIPHPLLMSFAASKPVYPIRLSALADSPLHLEIFACAMVKVTHPDLTVEYCDRHYFREDYDGVGEFRGQAFRRSSIAHPEAKKLFWSGCVLTRLSADLNPNQMTTDYEMKLSSYQPYRRQLYSHQGGLQTGLLVGMVPWCVGLILGFLAKNKRIHEQGGRRYGLLKLMLPLLLASAIVVGVVYVALPKVEVVPTRPSYHVAAITHVLASSAQILIGEYPATADWEPTAVAEFLVKGFSVEELKNASSGGPVRVEDSPGNFTVIEDERGMVFQAYRHDGGVYETVLQRPTPAHAATTRGNWGHNTISSPSDLRPPRALPTDAPVVPEKPGT